MSSRLEPSLLLTALITGLLATASGLVAGISPQYGLGVAVGAVFLVITLSNVTIGFCLLSALAIVDAQGNLGPAKIAGLILILSWLAAASTQRLRRAPFLATHPILAYGLLLFLAWVALSLLWAESGSAAIQAFTRYAPNALLIVIGFDAMQERRHAVWLIATIAGAATIAAVVGVVNRPPDPSTVSDVSRVSSTFGDANELAAALVVGAALSAAFALRRETGALLRLAACAATALCLFVVFLTLSRGGLVALAAALLAAVLVSGRWRRRVVLIASMILMTALSYFILFASLPARERVTNAGGGTGRVDLWTVGWRMLVAHPLNGVGAGNFPVSSIHYLLRPGLTQRADFIISIPLVAHNTYLQTGAELGVPAAILFIAVILFCLGSALLAAHRFASAEDVGMEILARGVVVGLVGYLTAMFFISEEFSKLLWTLLALGPALLALSGMSPKGRERASR